VEGPPRERNNLEEHASDPPEQLLVPASVVHERQILPVSSAGSRSPPKRTKGDGGYPSYPHQLVVADHTKDWQIVLKDPVGQNVVLYNRAERKYVVCKPPPKDDTVTVEEKHPPKNYCPMCGQELFGFHRSGGVSPDERSHSHMHMDPQMTADYFLLIDKLPGFYRSRGSSPGAGADAGAQTAEPAGSSEGKHGGKSSRYGTTLPKDAFNEGYYKRFFEEKQSLGVGSFGSVFLCHHKLQGVVLGSFAVKKIPVGDSTTWCLKVLQEVTILQTLHHPNIVDYKHSWLEHSKASDFSPEVPCLFVLMEYADRGNLAKYVWPDNRRPRILEDITVIRFLDDICQGLKHLHLAGLIHRDLKPENILIKTTGEMREGKHSFSHDHDGQPNVRLLISDFGQTYFKGTKLRRPGFRGVGHYGTVSYLAPEALVEDRGIENPYCEASDMWSIGAILYVMAYSDLPFLSEDAVSIRAEILERDLDLDSKRQKRPMEIKEIIKGLMRVNPGDRLTLDEVLGIIYQAHQRPKGNQASVEPVRKETVPTSKSLTPVVRPMTGRENSIENLEPLAKTQIESRAVVPSPITANSDDRAVGRRRPRTNLLRNPSFTQRLWQIVQEQQQQISPKHSSASIMHLFLHLFQILLLCFFMSSPYSLSVSYALPTIVACAFLIWLSNAPERVNSTWMQTRRWLPVFAPLFGLVFKGMQCAGWLPSSNQKDCVLFKYLLAAVVNLAHAACNFYLLKMEAGQQSGPSTLIIPAEDKVIVNRQNGNLARFVESPVILRRTNVGDHLNAEESKQDLQPSIGMMNAGSSSLRQRQRKNIPGNIS